MLIFKHLHTNNTFHQDLKPENVLIREDEKIKLADLQSMNQIIMIC